MLHLICKNLIETPKATAVDEFKLHFVPAEVTWMFEDV